MQVAEPVVQGESGTLAEAQSAPGGAGPVFDGPAGALWVGTGSVLAIFLAVLILIIRGRVLAPARRKTRAADAAPTTFFEPAGAGAEIEFDEPDAIPYPTESRRKKSKDKKRKAKERATAPRDEPAREQVSAAESSRPAPEKAASPFAGLFASKDDGDAKSQTPEEQPAESDADDNAHRAETARFLYDRDDAYEADAPAHEPAEPRAEPRPDPAIDEERVRRAEAAAEAAKRYAEQEARRAREEEERQARLAAEAIERAEERARLAETREQYGAAEIEEKLKAVEDAQRSLSATSNDLRGDVHRLREEIGASIEERFSAFAGELHKRLEENGGAQTAQSFDDEDAAPLSEAHFEEFANLIGEQIDALRLNLSQSISTLTKRLDALALASNAPQRPTAGHSALASPSRTQLAEILQDAMTPARYALGARLANDKTADGLVKMPAGGAPIAIDARFPVEAFDAYFTARADRGEDVKAENELRRVILRHIVSVSERLIVRGETADYAFAFVPSEQLLAELHRSFADIVQESYRARVWFVSPTSLMATLHTISAITMGAAKPGDETTLESLAAELRALRASIEEQSARPASRNNGAHEPQTAQEPTAASDDESDNTDEGDPDARPSSQPGAPNQPYS